MSRVAVVTGAASGMGLAMRTTTRRARAPGRAARPRRRRGRRRRRRAGAVGRRRARRARWTSPTARAVDDAMARVRAELGPIEIVVTSAGLDEFRSFTDITLEHWERMLAVNLTGTFHCVQAAIPDMLTAGWGRIVTISSSSAQSGAARMAHYVASKGGVIGLTKALALEYAPNGITVNTIPPGFVDTPMVRRAEARGDLPTVDAVVAAHAGPAGRHSRRHRGRVRVPLLRRRRVHHRPGDRRERRLVPVTTPAAPRLAPLPPRASGATTCRTALAAAFAEAGADRLPRDRARRAPDAERARRR